MKEITIFVTCADELALDKAVIGNLIRQLNIVNERAGLTFKLLDAQEAGVEIVANCDLFVGLFHVSEDSLSFEGVTRAINAFAVSKHPKVYIYFKDLSEGESIHDNLRSYKDYICNELGHYVNRYDTEDSIKFSIVMQVMQIDGTQKVEVRDSAIMLDCELIAKLENLNFASYNEHYKQLLSEVASARIELEHLDEDASERQKEEVTEVLRKKMAELHEYEKKLVEAANRFASVLQSGPSERSVKALELFNCGDIKTALAIFDEKQIEAEMEALISIQQVYVSAVKQKADDLLLKIQLLCLAREDGWLEKSECIYRKLIDAKDSLPRGYYAKEILLGYSRMLFEQGKFDGIEEKLIEAYNILSCIYKEESSAENRYALSLAEDYLCWFYLDTGRQSESLVYFEKAQNSKQLLFNEHPELTIVQEQAAQTKERNAFNYAHELGRWKKAVILMREAIDIWDRIRHQDASYHVDYAYAWLSLGHLLLERFILFDPGTKDEVEKTFKETLELLSSLPIDDDSRNKMISSVHKDLATLNDELGNYDLAQKEIEMAIDYCPSLPLYDQRGLILLHKGEFDKAEGVLNSIMNVDPDFMDHTEGGSLLWNVIMAQKGSIEALYHLGWMYETGHLVIRNTHRAFSFYLEAAQKGFPEAEFKLYLCYQDGIGVPFDSEESKRWLMTAALHGHKKASEILRKQSE